MPGALANNLELFLGGHVEHLVVPAVKEVCSVPEVELNQTVSLKRAAYGATSLRPRHETKRPETSEVCLATRAISAETEIGDLVDLANQYADLPVVGRRNDGAANAPDS